MVGNPWRVGGIALAVGIVFELTVLEPRPRIGVAVFIATVGVAVVLASRAEAVAVHRRSWPLVGIAGVLAVAAALPGSGYVTVLVAGVAAGVVALLVLTLRHGDWPRYGFRDLLLGSGRLTGTLAVGPPRLLMSAATAVRRNGGESTERLVPVLRGVAMALPILVFFGVLLGSADPVFADRLGRALDVLTPADFGQAVTHTVVAGVVAALAAGLCLHAITAPQMVLRTDAPIGRRFGPTEATIVLGSVDALFAAFVALQVRYLFGGRGLVLSEGLEYASYARRGFAELLVVAAASLVLLLAFAGTTRRDTPGRRRLFSLLGAGLTVLVLLILASAFQRLLLYEEAFGFTRLRVWAHAFMVWLGVLFVAMLGMELRGRLRQFALACGAATVGFTLTLALLNVDGIIAKGNLARGSTRLDVAYLAGLSVDAVPALVAAYDSTGDARARAQLGRILACHARSLDAGDGWASWSLSDWRARRALATVTVPTACVRSP